MSTRVLIIPDEPNWALDKSAKDLLKYNQSDLELDICYNAAFLKEWSKYYNEYDLLFPMYKGLFFSHLRNGVPVDKSVTGIRSFYRWDKGRTQPPGYNAKPPGKIIRRLKKAVLVNTHCQKLWYIFSPYVPVIHTKYTCDFDFFYPQEKPATKKLIVGWTGSLTNHSNKRGFHEFIKPACDAVPGVELKVQSKEDHFITDDNQMRDFYTSLDLYLVASRCEGTPRPAIEAAACGVPVLSTDVGIIPELVEHGHNGFVVDRTIDAFVEKLQYCVDHREELTQMGIRIREKMQREFDWEHVIWQWTDFLKYALELRTLKSEGNLK